ncbi:hypothetical protein [Streptomyces sp. NRRL B-24484]|uniref:hypothetical protein n=1 Tax=Streptomyces sp. NRRL B-24484 TaxID=1463833 RepID=UPI0004C25DD2|nr:hypothetical protein [Streptomyces sp. NRRL B-24484]
MAGALAAVLTGHHTYKALAPLRRRLRSEQHGAGCKPVPAPSPEQLAADLRIDSAHRAAAGAGRLDCGQGSLTKAANWAGQPDGSATCELTPAAHLLAVPRPTDHGGYSSRSYLLVTGADATPVEAFHAQSLCQDQAEQPSVLRRVCRSSAAGAAGAPTTSSMAAAEAAAAVLKMGPQRSPRSRRERGTRRQPPDVWLGYGLEPVFTSQPEGGVAVRTCRAARNAFPMLRCGAVQSCLPARGGAAR